MPGDLPQQTLARFMEKDNYKQAKMFRKEMKLRSKIRQRKRDRKIEKKGLDNVRRIEYNHKTIGS